MTEPTYDRRFWEDRWSQVVRDHSDQVARRPPNEWLISEAANLQPGLALDAGCGHGSDTLWLAARGWQVTAVDFSATRWPSPARRPRRWARKLPSESTGWRAISRRGPRSRRTTTSWSRCTSMWRIGRSDGASAGSRSRPWRDPLHGRPPPDRPDHRSRNGGGRSASGLGRHRDRSARSRPLDVPRRRGPTEAHGRDRRRRRRPRSAPALLDAAPPRRPIGRSDVRPGLWVLRPTELVQAGFTDAEMVADLVEQCDSHSAGQLLGRHSRLTDSGQKQSYPVRIGPHISPRFVSGTPS